MIAEIYSEIFGDIEVFWTTYAEDAQFLQRTEKKKIEKELLVLLRTHIEKQGNHNEDKYVSVSHKFPYVTMAVSDKNVGIDIEEIQPKIKALTQKFLSAEEKSWVDIEDNIMPTLCWSVKEALYKLSPTNFYSFSKNYRLLDREGFGGNAAYRLDNEVWISCKYRFFIKGNYVFSVVWESA